MTARARSSAACSTTRNRCSRTSRGHRAGKQRPGTREVNLALLTDGLRAEREQGITIDVAYRYFATPRRKFIIADSPGHVQYTRNMVTGASTARTGAHPGGRAQGCRRTDAASSAHDGAPRHSAPGALREQDGPRRLVAVRVSSKSKQSSVQLTEPSAWNASR